MSLSSSCFPSRPRFRLLLALLLPGLGATSAKAAEIAGKWAGTLAHGTEQVPAGLEFVRQADASLTARVTVPASHMLGVPVGPVTQAGDKIEGSGLTLTLQGDELSGTIFGPARLTLHRATELPAAPAKVEAPAGPEPVWSYHSSSPFWATPVVSGGTVFAGSQDGVLHAVHANDGRPLWTRPTGGAILGAALVAGNTVYVGNDAGLLLALDATSGTERWRTDLGGGDVPRVWPADEPPYGYDYQAPAPVLADGVLYIGSADGGCHALDAASGRRLWRYAGAGKIRNTALVLGDAVVFASVGGTVYALDRATGNLRWSHAAGEAVTTSPVLADGRIVIGTRSCFILALDPADGHRAWERFQWLSWVESTPEVVDGTIYIGSSDNRKVRALAATDGSTRWSTEVGGWAWARPAVGQTTVYAAVAGPDHYMLEPAPVGGLCALERSTGRLLWRRPSAITPGRFLHGFAGAPALAGDLVIVAGLDSRLEAFPVGTPTR